MAKIKTLLLIVIVAIVAVGGTVWVLKGVPETESTTTFGFSKDSAKLQVGFLTVGPVSDWGYNYAHNLGRLEMEAALRDKVKTVVAENIPETADAERVAQRMINEGAKLVYMTSYGYADATHNVAGKNPDGIFMQALGSKTADNVGTYSLRVWEGAYVCGVIAAMTLGDETQYGFLGAHPVPPINWTVNAFALGAQSVNPDVTVNIVYTNSWYDPAAEAEAVKSLSDKGIKVVYVLVDSPIAGVQAAERAGIHSLAHFADLSEFAPKGWLTGTIWKWGSLYSDATNSVLDDAWESGHVGGGMTEGYVDIASFGPAVPEAARKKARVIMNRIAADPSVIFSGPIYDTKGVLRIPEGKAMSVPEIIGFDWLVRGVSG